MIIFEFLFFMSAFLILFSLIGYPMSMYILDKIIKRTPKVDLTYRPMVSIIVPAHNEEAVIEKKLDNLCNLNYPVELMEIIISSDNSTDRTNEIVEEYIRKNPDKPILLYKVKKRQGKTNAQNEAVRIAKGEILVFSDANSMLDKDAIIHLVSSFTSDDIVYVCGRLKYVNNLDTSTSEAESRYWDYDLFMRKVESKIKTITAGNGAIYAIRKREYVEFDPIRCHDSAMPLEAALNNKRALYNEKAVAYEKAGETDEDEYKRKVRMFRNILTSIFGNPRKYNIFKYGWFSYFYFGHRTLRYSLFILHIICFISNLFLVKKVDFYAIVFVMQILFYILAVLGKVTKKKMFYYPYYYCLTLLAQLYGAINQLTGKAKPFWEKAESTR